MFPQRELATLAGAKARLRLRIAARRREFAALADRATRPLLWIDAGVALWRQIGPLARFALVPLGCLFGRRLARPVGRFGRLLRWAPMIIQAVRGWRENGRQGSSGR